MMAAFLFIAHEKGFLLFHAQPQTGAYSCYHGNHVLGYGVGRLLSWLS